jgi:CspA family cold shock protein
MSIGTVKWFDAAKGFGFIAPDDGSSDVFLHVTALERAGFGPVAEGDKLGYQLERDIKSDRMSAGQLTRE